MARSSSMFAKNGHRRDDQKLWKTEDAMVEKGQKESQVARKENTGICWKCCQRRVGVQGKVEQWALPHNTSCK